jgi:hypothetical protein
LNEATLAWLELEYNRERHAELGMAPMARFLAGPDVTRPSPSSEELRACFTAEEQRTQRKSDGTISVEGKRFEVPSRYRHLDRICIRYARWDLSHVYLVDERASRVLGRLYPLDKVANGNALRRSLEPHADMPAATPVQRGMAPLLKQLMTEHAARGLPPAYVPLKHDTPSEDESR